MNSRHRVAGDRLSEESQGRPLRTLVGTALTPPVSRADQRNVRDTLETAFADQDSMLEEIPLAVFEYGVAVVSSAKTEDKGWPRTETDRLAPPQLSGRGVAFVAHSVFVRRLLPRNSVMVPQLDFVSCASKS